MDKFKDFVDVFVEPFLLIATLIVVCYNAYFKKKAENVATKEDVGEITNEIEKVKVQFQKDFADYQLIGQHQFSIVGEQRKAILEYNEALQFLINMSINSAFDSALLSYHEPDDAAKRFFEWNTKQINAYHRLILLMPNTELEGLNTAISKRIKDIQRLILKHIRSFGKGAYVGSTDGPVHINDPMLVQMRGNDQRKLTTDVTNIYIVLKDENKEMMKVLQSLIQIAFKK